MTHPSLFDTRFFLIVTLLMTAVVMSESIFSEENTEQRYHGTTTWFRYHEDDTDLPVLCYYCSSGHHFPWISESRIERIFIWKDGTVAWSVHPEKSFALHLYQTTIPVEKIEAAVMEIARDSAKFPSKGRPRSQGIAFRLGADYSPTIRVHSQIHFESLWVDHYLMKFYQNNQEVFQSGDNEAILKTLKTMGGFVSYKGLVDYYRRLPQAGLSEKSNPEYSEEEILKCAAFYVADIEHLLLMEAKILELLPSTEGLEPKEIDYNKNKSYRFLVEWGIKEGNLQFFYSPISESEQ